MSYIVDGPASNPPSAPNPWVEYAPGAGNVTMGYTSSVDYGKFDTNGVPQTVQPHPPQTYTWR